MTVQQEILEWAEDRPVWQRDTLHRLACNGELLDEDIKRLVEICKSSHGLFEKSKTKPFEGKPKPEPNQTRDTPVSLVSIFHGCGVNALAENQTLKFGSGLTVVYGDNGAGKTGYTRILKNACRARGSEKILGNVVSEAIQSLPVAVIEYKVGAEANPGEWVYGCEDEFVSRVSVFDTQCATIYLTEKTDVAFRPFGLDLFDKLVQACKAVNAELEAAQRALGASELSATLQETIQEGTAVAKFLANVSSLTKPETLQALAELSPKEETRLTSLEKTLIDLQVNDSKKLIKQLTLREKRIQDLVSHLEKVEVALADSAVKLIFDTWVKEVSKSEEAKRMRDTTLPQGILRGTGGNVWRELWESARRFSKEQAYPEKPFPFVSDGAKCVLCQQGLDNTEVVNRLAEFAHFTVSTVERELREIRDSFMRQKRVFTDLKIMPETVSETLQEVRIEYEVEVGEIIEALQSNEKRQTTILSALTENKVLADDCAPLTFATPKARSLLEQIKERIEALRIKVNDEAPKCRTQEVQELRARKLLAKHQQEVLNEIERQKKYAAYSLCINDTKTREITTKSTAVTKEAVSQKLKGSFQDELDSLSFRHDVKVELKEMGGAEGVFYHQLVLTRPPSGKRTPSVELPKVVSEGEQRCLSIAAFFAELSTTDDLSGIVFDDPVSSLDFQWRNAVARRLVQESKKRQVIVFTHDVVFLLALRQYAEELEVKLLDQHIRHQSEKGAGVCVEELPWVALPVKKKIGYLKNGLQGVEKLSRDGNQELCEKEVMYLYGLLREAWERALEEVLLNGVVERYRPSVQTQRIAQIADDISSEDCKAIETAMTKCSAWLPGHDTAPAARAPVPMPTELKNDIEMLEHWISEVYKRRKRKT